MVWLIKMAFRDDNLQEELTWETMIFLPKGKRGYLRIGLVELACKVCVAVVNFA